MFGYNQNAPLDVQIAEIQGRDGVSIRDLSYSNVDGSRVAAYLVAPSKPGKSPGIVFLHGGEQSRSAFLDEAFSWATLGAASLLIDEPSVRAMPDFAEPEVDRDRYIRIILKLRRGVDLLVSLPEIDSERIGYSGLSFGAWMGAILSSVEKRIKAYVLIAGPPSMTAVLRSNQNPAVVQIRECLTNEQMENYLHTTASLDALHYISRAGPSALFFQFARHDELISERAALEYLQVASEPKLIKWYEAQHHNLFINKAALRDRVEWLEEQLELASFAH